MSPPQDTPCSTELIRHDVTAIAAAAAAAASSDPKRHGDNGGDHGNSAPSKKRATSSGCSDESSSSLPPKKRQVTDCVSSGSNGYVKRETPAVLQHGGGGAPAGSSSAASCPPNLDPALAKEIHRCAVKFGKEKFTVEALMPAAATHEPPKEKLMHDGIRAAAAMHVAVAAREKKTATATATASGTHNNDDARNGVPQRRFSDVETSVELRKRLEELGATEPQYVCRKMLQRSDVDLNQNRLLVSCKRDLKKCPITYIFTDDETHIVQDNGKAVEEEVAVAEDDEVKEEEEADEDEIVDKDKDRKNKKKKPGLRVTMFDQSGDKYRTICRYLNSNGGYRFIGEWGKFLRSNSMAISRGEEWTRNIIVKLWAFRSRKLPRAEQSGHPDGALGFIVVHYENDGGGNDDSDGDDNDEEYKGKAPPTNAKKNGNNSSSRKEPVKATSSSSSVAAAVASSSAAAGVARKQQVTAARVTRTMAEDLEREEAAIQGIVKLLWGQRSSSSSSSENNKRSKPSSDEEEKADD
ncbi:hypothetical protein E2562_034992 [Oryza meyeriana var. granulata]|uniref:Uncharacterized protein n=1 Tax=Oryza meyeriana var. granulata TaxID=110450 RepID=A0A6G1CKQ9_9ORYZ|nr:hypothetical protein E2562_034992 [Oryza meyeriana var. granulata]